MCRSGDPENLLLVPYGLCLVFAVWFRTETARSKGQLDKNNAAINDFREKQQKMLSEPQFREFLRYLGVFDAVHLLPSPGY